MLNILYIMFTLYCTAMSSDVVTSDHHGNQQQSGFDSTCAVRDHQYQPQHYVLGPSKWNKSHLSFRIVNFPASLSEAEVRRSISDAFHVWSDVSRLSFHELTTGNADISIEFLTGFHGDGYPFDGPGNIVAHAFFPDDVHGGKVHFDADEKWTVSETKGLNLFMVAAHEIGHALGVSHSTVTGALMSRWHRDFNTDFILPDDDVAAIQRLYGPSDSSTRRVFPAPSMTPLHTSSMTSSAPSYSQSTSAYYPDPCHTSLDAISVIRGQLIAFKDNWFWKLGSCDQTRHSKVVPPPTPLQQFWFGLPVELQRVDAVFERPSDGRIFIFSGKRYWEISGSRVLRKHGRSLTQLGLPADVSRVDAAFVWGHLQRMYLVTGRTYWRLVESGQSVLLHGYPRDVTGVWAGVKIPIDAAFTHTDGRSYFFSGDQYWQFNDARMHIQRGYPRPIGPRWFACTDQSASASRSAATSPHTANKHISTLIVIILTIFSQTTASRCPSSTGWAS